MLVPNTTCDIYRNGNAPPASPDVAAVPILLTPRWTEGRGGATYIGGSSDRWTHMAVMAYTVDIRDDYSNSAAAGTDFDFVYVPDKNGTKFKVRFVQRRGWNSSNDIKEVFLDRFIPTWPSNNV